LFAGKEAEPLESEGFHVHNADTLVAACGYRMVLIRRKYPETPPDGFIIFDHHGKEVRRWFDLAMP
jgi:hypothetical protein